MLPKDTRIDVNPGALRTQSLNFLTWIIEVDHPYQFE